ncbi:MAG: hypothetical protein GF320_14540 [Armatimonadia bacterium]|nr:hypothetical protein [Armatimonadia bacterium]
MARTQREGVLIEKPAERLSPDQVALVDETSRAILEDPGILCYNEEAVDLFTAAGAKAEKKTDHWVVTIPPKMVDQALESAPSEVVLGARDPKNRLVLNAEEPRVRFVSGSETNVWIDVDFVETPSDDGTFAPLAPRFTPRQGSIEDLRMAAHLADNLDNLDSFIRCVNIQDPEVTEANKDVNKFFASLDNITKHVQAGLTTLDAIDDVANMVEIIAGGPEAAKENPLVSFITCLVKSPLQMVDDTTAKSIAFARRGIPMVVSSSPMGGATAPFDEFGMVAQINAEILAGLVITQLASAGAPILYGSVPVRTRLDNLNDMYGAPDFVHYNIDCTQMARHYKLPCYSTAGVGDAEYPGIQATAEKLLTLVHVPLAGAQYVHYAFGLLDRTNNFCPEQAIMDNAHISMVKHLMADSTVRRERKDEVLSLVREIMASGQKVYMYHLPLPTQEDVYVRYPLENAQGGALMAAHEEFQRIKETPRNRIPADVRKRVASEVKGLLPKALAEEAQ